MGEKLSLVACPFWWGSLQNFGFVGLLAGWTPVILQYYCILIGYTDRKVKQGEGEVHVLNHSNSEQWDMD